MPRVHGIEICIRNNPPMVMRVLGVVDEVLPFEIEIRMGQDSTQASDNLGFLRNGPIGVEGVSGSVDLADERYGHGERRGVGQTETRHHTAICLNVRTKSHPPIIKSAAPILKLTNAL
jgi:hypothetical protein